MTTAAPPIDARLVAMASGNFVVGVGVSLTIGLLNEIAQDLDVSIPVAGQLVAAMSITIAVAAPVLAFATSAIARRLLLTVALAGASLCFLLSAAAPGFLALLLVRVLAGLPSAVYTPAAAATAGTLTPVERRGQAVMAVGLGHSAASIVGVPAGVFLGGLFGWRVAMVVFGVLAAVVTVWLRATLPARLPQARLPAGALGVVLRNRGVMSTLGAAFLQSFGQMMLFSYIAPILKDMMAASTGTISLLLAWLGVCGLLGNLVGVRQIGRLGATRMAFVALGCNIAGQALWPLGYAWAPAVLLSCTLWGLGMFALNSAQQARLIGFAPELGGISVAFNTALLFAGGALAAALGGVVIAQAGLSAVSWVGTLILLLGLAALRFSQRYDPPPSHPPGSP